MPRRDCLNHPILGDIQVVTGPDNVLVEVSYGDRPSPQDNGPLSGVRLRLNDADEVDPPPAGAQIAQYLEGTRRHFSCELELRGTDFQVAVWRAIARIPYGETATYADIARAVGRPRATRAVGAACGRNPLTLVIPCHRVVGANRALTGYGGGLPRKQWLLRHETAASAAA
jgi:methylated-DNA-[protein]-cysteine S-methyltransferase